MHARSSFLFLLAAGFLWGTGGVIGTALADVTGLPAPAVAAYRLGLGGLVLVAIAMVRTRTVPRSLAAWTRIVAVGVLAAIFQSSYFTATSLGSVSSATLITIGSAPMFVLAHDVLRHRALPTLTTVRPVAVGVAGLVLLIGDGAAPGDLAGSVFALVSGAAFAAFTLVARRPVDADAVTVIGYGFVVGGTLIALCAAPVVTLTFVVDPHSLALLALFATAPTAVAYVSYFRGLAGASAATATVVALLEPLTAAVLAVALLGDRFTLVGLVGAALLLVSVLDAGSTQVRTGRGPHTMAA